MRILPARAAEVEAADVIALGIRLAIIVLGAILVIRLTSLVIKNIEKTIRAQAHGEHSGREKRARTIGGVLRGGTRGLVFVVAVLMAVRELGLDITPALAAAGGFGVAAGLGAQSLVRDWISGFFIIFDDQFGVGDTVRVSGVAGSIERLTLRHTELRDSDGSLHFIPNGEIKIVTNLTKSWAAPLLRIPISTSEDPDRAMEVLNEMVSKFKADPATAALMVDGPNVLGIDDVAVGQFTILIQGRTRPENRHPATRLLRLAAVRKLREEGISLYVTPPGLEAAAPAPMPTGDAPAPAPTPGATA